jgi:CRP-like cAMP-binding protein
MSRQRAGLSTLSAAMTAPAVNRARPGPLDNHLLAALPAADFARLEPNLKRVALPLGDVLYESGERLTKVFFPTTSIISLHYVMRDGASGEIAGVGNEGILGISLFMGGQSTPSRALVQTGGDAWCIEARLLMAEFDRGGALLRLLLRYSQALITQMAQTGACNRHHSVEQQLCRWLLLTLDRVPGDDLVMTQELIAGMLGVRRESVTEAAGRLKQVGLISYRRGHIRVLDRPGLQSQVCECYAVVKDEFARLLGDPKCPP